MMNGIGWCRSVAAKIESLSLALPTVPEFTTVVRRTRSPQTIGDDQPRPGKSVFQATFSVADQRSGNPSPVATPFEPGPRNCGQFVSALTGKVAAKTRVANDIDHRGIPFIRRPFSSKFTANRDRRVGQTSRDRRCHRQPKHIADRELKHWTLPTPPAPESPPLYPWPGVVARAFRIHQQANAKSTGNAPQPDYLPVGRRMTGASCSGRVRI